MWDYYAAHGRNDLPWRQPEPDGSFDPYKILVSEVMLQQTQVSRVIPKFRAFVTAFPTIDALAAAPLAEPLRLWSGLGYNRRAKFLWQAAQQAAKGLPKDSQALRQLSGIGPNTAGAILAYAYNQPAVFIETNIRTVFMHHFFSGQQDVRDAVIADVVARSLPDNPRAWYWALMDYGTHLKQTVGNLNVASAHYVKQSPFEGSRRQIRGQLLRLLGTGSRTKDQLAAVIPDEHLVDVLKDLTGEGLIQKQGSFYTIGTE